MATLTFASIRTLIRDEMNEQSTVRLTDTELGRIVNDAYKDVCVKALAYEKKITKTNISSAERIISLVGENVIRVTYVEYDIGTGCIGMVNALPNTVGYSSINDYTPQYWFQFGEYLIVEPIPDAGTYDLYVYASCYPASELSADADLPSNLPSEFHECIYDYGMAMSNIKFSRWGSMTAGYNYYHQMISAKQAEYIRKTPDVRKFRTIPDQVVMQQQRQQQG